MLVAVSLRTCGRANLPLESGGRIKPPPVQITRPHTSSCCSKPCPVEQQLSRGAFHKETATKPLLSTTVLKTQLLTGDEGGTRWDTHAWRALGHTERRASGGGHARPGHPMTPRATRPQQQSHDASLLNTLVTGPRRSLSRKLSDARVYAPQITWADMGCTRGDNLSAQA